METNDAVTVAGMTRPKPLPNEVLSDLAVSAATKLQCYRVFFFFFFWGIEVMAQLSVQFLSSIYVAIITIAIENMPIG